MNYPELHKRIADLEAKLAASEAREKQMRIDMEAIASGGIRIPSREYAMHALALPADDSALREYVAKELKKIADRYDAEDERELFSGGIADELRQFAEEVRRGEMLNDTKWLLEEAVRTGKTALIERERAANLLDDLARFNARLNRIVELEALVKELEKHTHGVVLGALCAIKGKCLSLESTQQLSAHQEALRVAKEALNGIAKNSVCRKSRHEATSTLVKIDELVGTNWRLIK